MKSNKSSIYKFNFSPFICLLMRRRPDFGQGSEDDEGGGMNIFEDDVGERSYFFKNEMNGSESEKDQDNPLDASTGTLTVNKGPAVTPITERSTERSTERQDDRLPPLVLDLEKHNGVIIPSISKDAYYVLDFDGVINKNPDAFANFVNRYYVFGAQGKNYNLVDRVNAEEVTRKYFKSKITLNVTKDNKQRWVLLKLLPRLVWTDGSNHLSIYSGNGSALVEQFFSKITNNCVLFNVLVGELDENDLNSSQLEKKEKRKAPSKLHGQNKRSASSRTFLDFSSNSSPARQLKLGAHIQHNNAPYPATSVSNSMFNIGGSKVDLFTRLIQNHMDRFFVYVDDNENQAKSFVEAYKRIALKQEFQLETPNPLIFPDTDERVVLYQVIRVFDDEQKRVVAHVWNTISPYWLFRTYGPIIANAEAVAPQNVSRMPDSNPFNEDMSQDSKSLGEYSDLYDHTDNSLSNNRDSNFSHSNTSRTDSDTPQAGSETDSSSIWGSNFSPFNTPRTGPEAASSSSWGSNLSPSNMSPEQTRILNSQTTASDMTDDEGSIFG